jgi:hypothetical protein
VLNGSASREIREDLGTFHKWFFVSPSSPVGPDSHVIVV